MVSCYFVSLHSYTYHAGALLKLLNFHAELTGGLQVANTRHGNRVLISGFFAQGDGEDDRSKSGILAIDPRSGAERWRRTLYARPVGYDCAMIDANGDGADECVVVGQKGMLTMLETETGATLWTLHHHIPLTNLSLPRRLPDLDGDGADDLLSAGAVVLPSGVGDRRSHSRTNLVLVSGRTGAVVGRPYLLKVCSDIAAVNVTSNAEIRIDCDTNDGGKVMLCHLYRIANV